MPTGTGKTRLFTSIISDIKAWSIHCQLDVKVLIIAHRIELIEQISENLEKYKVRHGIIAGGKERNLSPQVQVASIQTLTHHLNLSIAKELNVNFVIIDEAHHSMANSYRKLWELYPDAKKLGVTATPWRMNNSGFVSVYDTFIPSEPINDFISAGWLAPFIYYSVKESSNIQRKIDSISEFDIDGDYKISALERVMDNKGVRAQLLDSYLKYAKGKKGIVYSFSRKHSDHICSEFKAAGLNVVRIDSKTPKDERKLYVKRFKEGLVDIIVNVDIFSEGFDCPDIEFIQLARPTKSLVKYMQQVGRGLRPIKGKSNCIILDNVGLHIQFGLPNAYRNWSDFFYGESNEIKSAPKSHKVVEIEHKEQTFTEGDDEMFLVSNSSAFIQTKVEVDNYIDNWSDSDISLLKALYVEKQCSLEVLQMVFKRNANDINQKLIELDL